MKNAHGDEIVIARYQVDDTLAVLAEGDDGRDIASVNLSAYGLDPGRNSIFVPGGVESLLDGIAGDWADERTPYGPYDATARRFTFHDDVESMAEVDR
jgi:hypothetical protein